MVWKIPRYRWYLVYYFVCVIKCTECCFGPFKEMECVRIFWYVTFSAALVILLFRNNHDFEYFPNCVLLLEFTLLYDVYYVHLNRILKSVCFPRVFLASTSESLKGTWVIKILHIHFEFIKALFRLSSSLDWINTWDVAISKGSTLKRISFNSNHCNR